MYLTPIWVDVIEAVLADLLERLSGASGKWL